MTWPFITAIIVALFRAKKTVHVEDLNSLGG